jgi:diguanylate cyclase (GGDEF)-like protein
MAYFVHQIMTNILPEAEIMSIIKQRLGRVLIISREEAQSLLIKAWLQPRGFEVKTITGQSSDLRQQLRQGFEVVICDDYLPELPPEELLQIWQSLGQDGFIILTGRETSPERMLDLVSKGAFTYLLKPVPEEKLVQALSQGRQNREVLLKILGLSEELTQANQRLQKQTRRLKMEQERLKEQTAELNFINSFSYSLTTTLEPARLATIIAQELSRLVDFSFFGLDWFQSPEERKIFLYPALAPEGQEVFVRQLPHEENFSSGAREKLPEFLVLKNDTAPDKLVQPPRYQEYFPLEIGGELVGSLALAGERPFDLPLSRHKLLRSLGPYMALAMKNSLDHEQLRSRAELDSLTQALNRHMFDHHLRREFISSRRYDYPLSLILIDVDHFKKINDTHGHLVGDGVLKRVAEILQQEIRETDYVARYGGDEFALILPHTELRDAVKLAKRLHRQMGQSTFSNGLRLKVTLSLGIADNRQVSGDDQEELVHQADQALYLSKVKGRNTFSTITSPVTLDQRPTILPLGSQFQEQKISTSL